VHLQEHLDALDGDPTRRKEFDQFKPALGALENQMKQSAKMAEMAAQNEQQPQGPTPEEMKIQGEIEIMARRAQGEAEIKAFTAKQEAAIRDAKEAQAIRHQEINQRQKMAAHEQDMRIAEEKSKAAEKTE
jgi:hypothetical protein